MAVFIVVSGLNDAYLLLNTVKGLPSSPQGKRLANIYTRSAVMFSWMALESIVRSEIATRKLVPKSQRLWDKIDQLLKNKPAKPGSVFDSSKATFTARRAIRNGISHALASAAIVTVADAEAALAYCTSGVGALTGLNVKVE